MSRESLELAEQRWDRLRLVQEHYRSFIPFLHDVMEELGFDTTEIQEDIAGYIAYGPQYIMVQAQRSQAKTTIAAAYAVWCLIHSPAHRVLIISAGGTQAMEISTLIVRIIMTMDVLECLQPDKMAGDRTATDAFDIHHSLKGMDKSPSVACVGIDSNLQGKRADLLIPDDIESSKNSATAVQRAKLLHLTKDFISICQYGRIVWLGTPQTMDSIYNSLPARGVSVRIWPGRYPTEKQMDFYGDRLAPLILQRLRKTPELAKGGGYLGNQGQPLDPNMPGLDEAGLQKKEQDQGEAYFQLQHMLNTTLSDALRYPLKPEKLVMLRTDMLRAPIQVVRGMLSTHMVDKIVQGFPFKVSVPATISQECMKFDSTWAYVDPAPGGANADETAYAIGGFLSGNVFVLSAGGIPGGYETEKLEWLAKHMAKFKIDGITIEKNMGFGAFRQVWTPILRRFIQCQLDDDLVTGQKEGRIINTLAPLMGRGGLIIDEAVIEEDEDRCAGYNASLRQTYSLFFQLTKMTLTRNALVHDDRVDALEGLVRHFVPAIAQDQEHALEAARLKAYEEMIRDPIGHGRYSNTSYEPRASLLRSRRR
jgi:hypothetical protein